MRSSVSFSVEADLLALQRVLTVFRRQGLKLEFLVLRPGATPDVWRVTAEVQGGANLGLVCRQLEKQLLVLSVSVVALEDATTA